MLVVVFNQDAQPDKSRQSGPAPKLAAPAPQMACFAGEIVAQYQSSYKEVSGI
jgi:hypothetical protein